MAEGARRKEIFTYEAPWVSQTPPLRCSISIVCFSNAFGIMICIIHMLVSTAGSVSRMLVVMEIGDAVIAPAPNQRVRECVCPSTMFTLRGERGIVVKVVRLVAINHIEVISRLVWFKRIYVLCPCHICLLLFKHLYLSLQSITFV